MGNFISKLDKDFDIDALVKEANEAKGGGGDFPEVPLGTYEVIVENLELKLSKAGNPMLSAWLKIDAGKFKNSIIFYNQTLHTGFGIHNANEFLRSMDTGVDVEFKSFEQYDDLIKDVKEACDKGLSFELEYGENKKGYSTYKITEVFEQDN